MKRNIFLILAAIFFTSSAYAKVDLVTLPARDSVQLTIYNSADLTLAQESRLLTLKQGLNELQFSWANTLIDPTSLEMLPKMNIDKIDILDLTFPPRVKDLGLWNIKSKISGQIPVEINYLTSGLSWRAFYLGTLSDNEQTMNLKGYVRVTNNSGEDYENAKVRMIVGQVHIIDQIADLARRQYPYDRPGEVVAWNEMVLNGRMEQKDEAMAKMKSISAEAMPAQKEIKKEGLSEYFLYTIEGTETIPTGWSKRLPSFDVNKIDVVNLYKYEEQMYGNQVVRFLSFANDKKHSLGDTPIPGGVIKVFRKVDTENHLSYQGQSDFKYIPVGEDVELNLGSVANVVVEPKLMDYKTKNYKFDNFGNIEGWDEIREFKIEIKNTRDVPVKIEIKRNFDSTYWDMKNVGDVGKYEKVDADTVKYTLDLNAKTSKELKYIFTAYQGTRQQR